MKTFAIVSVVLSALLGTVAGADEAAKPAPPTPPEETSLLADLRTAPQEVFQYGSWSGKVTATKSGLAVVGAKGAQGDGGMGGEITPARDLSQVAFVEVALGVVPGNEVPQFTVAFNDADGTQFTARITIDQLVPGSPVWLRARREDFKLNGVEKGSDSQMDWSNTTRWHLQGDWQTKKNFQVIFVALRTRK
jgi:hypothetical protein